MRSLFIVLIVSALTVGCTSQMPTGRYVDVALAELDAMGVFDTPLRELHEALTNHTLPEDWCEKGIPARVRIVSRSLPASAGFVLPQTSEHLKQLGYPPAVSAGAFVAVARVDERMFFEVHLRTQAGMIPVGRHGAALIHLTSLEDAKLVASGKYRQHLAEAADSPAIRADTNYKSLHIERIIAAELEADTW